MCSAMTKTLGLSIKIPFSFRAVSRVKTSSIEPD
jgi:hypothetical protein